MRSNDPLTSLAAFGRILREADVAVGPDRLADALRGLARVDLTRRDDVYWTLRQTLVSRLEDLDTFDRGFTAWFDGVAAPSPERRRTRAAAERPASAGARDKRGDTKEISLGWSREEALRRKDFALLDASELRRVQRLIEEIAVERPTRSSRRLRRHRSGSQLDLRALLRASLATGGEPLELRYRRRVETPRSLVVLCDVSGSMKPHARALLLFAHGLARGHRRTEVFAFGTRLTRLTPELRRRDADDALAAVSRHVQDWDSGTRIGAALAAFNDTWGTRSLVRGAVVVIVSDGWELDDSELVGREMARLARASYAVVWVNPLKGDPEYQPLAGGMRAALPYIDRFISGQNLADLEHLAVVLGGIRRRRAA